MLRDKFHLALKWHSAIRYEFKSIKFIVRMYEMEKNWWNKAEKRKKKNLLSVGCDKDTESFITSRSCDNIEARTRAHTHTFLQKSFQLKMENDLLSMVENTH